MEQVGVFLGKILGSIGRYPVIWSLLAVLFFGLIFFVTKSNSEDKPIALDSKMSIDSNEKARNYAVSNLFFLADDNLSSVTQVLSFEKDGRFNHSVTNKRTQEKKIYSGNFDVKSSKYKNTGETFYYLKLVYQTSEWSSDPNFYVFYDENLIIPFQSDGNFGGERIKFEDQYGLVVSDYLIKAALPHNIFQAGEK